MPQPASLTLLEKIRRRLLRYFHRLVPPEGVRFDRSAGVDTEEWAEPSDLTVEQGSSAEGFSYVATPPRIARTWLDALGEPLEPFTFVDMGSGRGRVLLLASERPFRRIVGVEFAAELHEAAVENIGRFPKARMRCRDVTSICADAAAFAFPLDPLVVYFNNPFSEQVMRSVVHNLAASYEKRTRPIRLIYLQLAVEEPRYSTDNLGLLDRQTFLTGETIPFAPRDRRALERFLLRMYSSPEAASAGSETPF